MRIGRLPSKQILVTLIAFVAVVAIALSMTNAKEPKARIAAGGPKVVWGYITDSLGSPLDGAAVTVEVITPSLTVRDTQTDTTGSDGYYMFTFDRAVWDIGDTIRVTAVYDSSPQSNQTVADDSGSQQIDVNFGFVIPEFGSLVISMVVSVTIVCFAALRAKYRR
jgi:hypothetical protein